MAPALFIAPAAAALILTMAVPMADAVMLSLQNWNGMSPPSWAGFSNYLALSHDQTFFRALWHTAYFTVCTVILQTVSFVVTQVWNPVTKQFGALGGRSMGRSSPRPSRC